MTMMSAVVFVTLAIVVVALVATWIGKRRQQSVLAADVSRLLGAAAAHVVTTPTGSQVQEPFRRRWRGTCALRCLHIEQQIRANRLGNRPRDLHVTQLATGTSIVRCAASVRRRARANAASTDGSRFSEPIRSWTSARSIMRAG